METHGKRTNRLLYKDYYLLSRGAELFVTSGEVEELLTNEGFLSFNFKVLLFTLPKWPIL